MQDREEKRKFARLNILIDVSYKKHDVAQQPEKLTLTRNISKGGICFVGYEELKELDVIDLEIFLPEEKTPIIATGKVVWVKEFTIGEPSLGKRFDVGAEFIDISQKDLEKVDKYMFRHSG